jgi:hypothetical protein
MISEFAPICIYLVIFCVDKKKAPSNRSGGELRSKEGRGRWRRQTTVTVARSGMDEAEKLKTVLLIDYYTREASRELVRDRLPGLLSLTCVRFV